MHPISNHKTSATLSLAIETSFVFVIIKISYMVFVK